MTITYDMPFRDYLAMPGVHFSTLKHMQTSPLHYRRACDHERADTAALRLGRLVHAFILTPELPVDVAVFPGRVRRGRAWEEFEADALADGKLIVKADELDGARRMRDAVTRHGPARELLGDGHGEVTVTWEEPMRDPSIDGDCWTKVPCRARLDWFGSRGIVELKTTRFPGVRAWAREVAARSYHVQLAHYRAGVEENTGKSPPASWIVVESAPPYDVAVYRVRESDLEAGERLRQTWLRRVAECEASGRWPGVGGDAAIEFELPEYAVAEGLPEVDMDGIGGSSDGTADI